MVSMCNDLAVKQFNVPAALNVCYGVRVYIIHARYMFIFLNKLFEFLWQIHLSERMYRHRCVLKHFFTIIIIHFSYSSF